MAASCGRSVVPDTTAEASGAPTFTAQPGYQILYRGTAEQPKQFLSAATKGVDASDVMIASAENGGSVSYLCENHAATSQGSPYISLRSSEEVAEFIARGPGGDQWGFVNVLPPDCLRKAALSTVRLVAAGSS